MSAALLDRERIADQAKTLYERDIRAQVETPENIGKMLILDVDTGAFAVDDLGVDAARHLRSENPNARLFGIRIGYDVAAALGGVMERTAP